MAEAVVSVALSTLKDLLLQETKLLLGVRTEVQGLEKLLKEMQCLLKDAAKRQHESDAVRNWLSEIRDLAYRSEDIIETYSVRVSSRRSEKGAKLKMLLKRFSRVLNECGTIHDIGSQISEIKSEIERVYKSMDKYGICKEIIQGESSVSAFSENQRWRRQTYPFIKVDDCFIGMEDDVKNLVSLVVDDEQHNRVVSIWGMGGLGKTTVARKIYNHEEIKRSFDSFAWICVTQQCQIRSVFEDILKQLDTRDVELRNVSDAEIVRRLCEIQKSKRCLIVLDDVWKTDHWDALEKAFFAVETKSKIILTTRKQNVAAFGFAYKLDFLKEDDALDLLKKKAFPQKGVSATEPRVEEVLPWVEEVLQNTGKEIVRKCGYLPLGISLLGGVLRNRRSLEEWELVIKNLNAYLYKSNDNHEISSVVDLSYDELPSHLKACFLYMGRYKEDELIDAPELYRLWVAEGLVSQGAKDSLLDVAEDYLSELVSRCIVQAESVDDVRSKEASYVTCKLHDVVRELCLLKGKTEDFRLNVLYYEDEKLSTVNPTSCSSSVTRRLAVHFLGEEDIALKDGLECSLRHQINNGIRSLHFLVGGLDATYCDLTMTYGYWPTVTFPCNVLQIWKLKLLRVLVFVRCTFKGGKLPRQIGNLINLRNLTLQFSNLKKLPSSIRNLQKLITLDLTSSYDVRIPNVFKNMHHLKHLFLPLYSERENHRLTLECLDELEILSGFNSKVHDVESLTKMKNLLELEAFVYDNKTLSEILECINSNLNNLRICRLEIYKDCEFETSKDEDLTLLKKLMACSNLHYLTIVHVPIRKLLGAFDPCTTTHTIFPLLVSLQLYGCEIEDIDPMKMLQKLPCLKSLFLMKRSYVGETMICEAMGFPRLEKLWITELPNLRELKVEEGAMPNLSSLRIYYCKHLEMLPDGFIFVTTLKELTLAGMPELGKRVSAKSEDGREGDDYYKIRHVPIIKFR